MRFKPFELSILGIVIRFFTGLFLGIIGGVLGNLWIMLLVIPVMISAMLGLKIEFGTERPAKTREARPEPAVKQPRLSTTS